MKPILNKSSVLTCDLAFYFLPITSITVGKLIKDNQTQMDGNVAAPLPFLSIKTKTQFIRTDADHDPAASLSHNIWLTPAD